MSRDPPGKGRYGRTSIECPGCGAAVPRGAGTCYACGHRFHYWHVLAAVTALLLLFAIAVLVVRLFGSR